MTTFKVWVVVEKHNDETDKYEDMDLGFCDTAEFKSLAKAEQFADLLHRVGEQLSGGNKPL